ncbi:MAG: GAP family protein [Paracoccus sp. (in: a-proteobacteria)]
MSSVFAQYFPLAIGVAINPMSIIAIVILCIIGKAKAEGTVFVVGWFLSIIGFMVLTVLLGNGAASGAVKDTTILRTILQFAFIFLLLWLAWRNWISRPRKSEQITEPK